jgi:uncharacterized protein
MSQTALRRRSIRRAERAIPHEQAIAILQNGEFGILSTSSGDGRPYGVPLGYCYTDDTIYFHCALEGHKLENLCSNNCVSFCVVGKTEVLPEQFSTRYESAIVFGKALEVTGSEKQHGLRELLKKYSPGFLEKGLNYAECSAEKTRVYKIVIEYLTGKARR